MRTLGKTPRTQAGPRPWPEGLWRLDGTALKILHTPEWMGVVPNLASPELESPLPSRGNEESRVFLERREKLETL